MATVCELCDSHGAHYRPSFQKLLCDPCADPEGKIRAALADLDTRTGRSIEDWTAVWRQAGLSSHDVNYVLELMLSKHNLEAETTPN